MLLHCWLPGQTVPHAPQLFSSNRTSTQVLLQRVNPTVHTHTPLTHALAGPTPHELPQAPQFCVLVWVLTHWPLQEVSPNGHWHTPAAQVRPPGQMTLQPPQFRWSLCTSMQVPLQTARPAVQKQMPPMHCSLVAQARPQAPQLVVLVCRLTHELAGPEGVEGHADWPAGHDVTHTPLVQA